MKKSFTLVTGALALAIAAPAFAQSTSADMDMQSTSAMSASDYVKMAADSDRFEIQSSRVAATKSRREDVKGYAKQMIVDHTQSTKTVMAALTNQDRKIAMPSTVLSSDKQAKLTLLKKAPKASFDQLYLQQQLEAHQSALALHQGYATNGTDPALKQVAGTIAPTVAGHLSMVQSLMGTN